MKILILTFTILRFIHVFADSDYETGSVTRSYNNNADGAGNANNARTGLQTNVDKLDNFSEQDGETVINAGTTDESYLDNSNTLGTTNENYQGIETANSNGNALDAPNQNSNLDYNSNEQASDVQNSASQDLYSYDDYQYNYYDGYDYQYPIFRNYRNNPRNRNYRY